MPKAFSDREREQVRERLKTGARGLFSRFGLRKTTVDELVRTAGIAKGSFYLFFPSKEELYYDLLEEEEAALKRELLAVLEAGGLSRRARLKRLLRSGLEAMERSAFLRVMLDPGEMGYLLRKLPPERLAAHQETDSDFAEGFLREWAATGVLREVPVPVIAAAFRGVYLLAMQKTILGDEAEAVLTLYLDALTAYLLPGEEDDD